MEEMEEESPPNELKEKVDEIVRLWLELRKLKRRARTKIAEGRFKSQMRETISKLLDGLPDETKKWIQGEAKNRYNAVVYEEAKKRSRKRARRIRRGPKKPFELSDAQKERLANLKKGKRIK